MSQDSLLAKLVITFCYSEVVTHRAGGEHLELLLTRGVSEKR